MHHHQPDILQNLRHELSNGRMWLDRTVVLAYAAIAGLSVVGFTFLTNHAFAWFERVYHWHCGAQWCGAGVLYPRLA